MLIFICYAHENDDWFNLLHRPIERIARRVAGEHIELFSDRKIEPGDRWDEKIKKKILEADLFILLGSAAFVNSKYIGETEFPLILRKKSEGALFPILLTTVNAKFAPELRELQWKPSGAGLATYKDDEVEFDKQLLLLQEELETRLESIYKVKSGGSPNNEKRMAAFESAAHRLEPGALLKSPFVRFTFAGLAPGRYLVELEARAGSPPFKLAERTFYVTDPGRDLPANLFMRFSDELAPSVEAARAASAPIRIQLVFQRNAHHLDDIDWESVRWGGAQLGTSTSFILSRQFAFPEADYGELQIKTMDKIDYLDLCLDAEPDQVRGGITWMRPRPLPDWSKRHSKKPFRTVRWDPERPVRWGRLVELFKESEVVHLGLTVGVSTTASHDLRILLPVNGREGLSEESISDLSDLLQSLGAEQPTLIVLSPCGDGDVEVNHKLAYELAAARVPAIIAPVGAVDRDVWDTIVEQLVRDVADHGVIDLAVSVARVRARKAGFSILLYLRSRSARLWYRPSFVSKDGKDVDNKEVWSKLLSSLRAPMPCVALIGSNLEPTFSLSRRDMAKNMAKTFGFALSQKDREDLETVAEFIYVSQPQREGKPPPHVAAFTDAAKAHLVNIMSDADQNEYAGRTLRDVANRLADLRFKDANDAFSRLARLSVHSYITAYYHEILEKELRNALREPCSRAFRRRSIGGGADLPDFPKPSYKTPLVYHCFGSFEDESSLLLSKSDYLDFFAAYCGSVSDDLTNEIRRQLASSPLLVLGFRPNSSDFRMLLAVHRKLRGRGLSKEKIHIAVQVDPEDDHTIDPEGARTFYRGLLSELGENVYIYWGTPQRFLAEFETNCPDAFREAQ